MLEATTEALVNTVNCVGVMGKGIALQFKQAFPDNFVQYEKACRTKEVRPGKVSVFYTGNLFNQKYVINFPTKRHWKEKSRIADIKSGLEDIVRQIQALGIRSISIPPLGCGNGGLDWGVVKPIIEEAFEALPEITVQLYSPVGAPEVDTMVVNTSKPNLTKPRALLIELMKEYAVPGYRLSKLEVQKLAYFLQTAGEPLRLNFIKAQCGPYADNLNHVLQRLEGHYIRGYGDRAEESSIYLIGNAEQEAEALLKNESESLERLGRVKKMLWGFENPYGLELLSTVHWIMADKPDIADDLPMLVEEIHRWNSRKCNLFKPSHIEKAWKHLSHQNYLCLGVTE